MDNLIRDNTYTELTKILKYFSHDNNKCYKKCIYPPCVALKNLFIYGIDYFVLSEAQLGSSMPFLNLTFNLEGGVLPHLHECRILVKKLST